RHQRRDHVLSFPSDCAEGLRGVAAYVSVLIPKGIDYGRDTGLCARAYGVPGPENRGSHACTSLLQYFIQLSDGGAGSSPNRSQRLLRELPHVSVLIFKRLDKRRHRSFGSRTDSPQGFCSPCADVLVFVLEPLNQIRDGTADPLANRA